MDKPQSVASVIFSPDRLSVLLILRRDVPVWVLPGGGIEPNETPEAAAARETLEETGFTVNSQRLVGDYIPMNRLAKRTFLYECTILSGSPLISSETKGVQFFPLKHLPSMPPPYNEWIEDARYPLPPIQKKLLSVNYLSLIKHALGHPILVARFLLAKSGFPINSP